MAKKRSGTRRVCIRSGYMYEYGGKRWRSSKDDAWSTEVHKNMCGLLKGARRVDGATVKVVKVGRKFYAATPSHIFKPR